MSDTTFVPGTTITASWLNDVNDHVYNGQSFDDISVINVKDPTFGAVGDGTTDDYAAIQAAIDSATGALTGYCIYFPAGIYKTSGVLNVADKANMYFLGDGVNTTVIKPTAAVTAAVKFGVSGVANQGISKIHILCEDATSCIGIALTSIDGFWASDFKVSDASVGIDVVNGFGMYFNNFRVDNSIDAGIKVNGGNDQFFSNGVMLNPVGAQPTVAGIWVVKNEALWLSNIDCIYQKTGLLLAPTGSDYISWAFVDNCAFDLGTGDGIKVAPTASALVKGCNFTGCWTSSNTGYGLNVDGAGTVDGLRFTSHRSYANGLSGYYLNNTGTVENVAFASSEASGNSAGGSGVYSGFDIAANISEFSIIGCRSGPMSGLGDTQARGIIVNAGTSDNYIIVGNDLRGNTTGMVEGGSGTTKHIAHNLNAVTQASGASTVAIGASTRVITHGLIGTPTAQDIVITDASGRAASGITDVWVSALGATTFQVNTNTNVTTTAFSFGWSARIKGA